MSLPLDTAENIAEKLYDFNANLRVKIKPGNNEVIATIDSLKMSGEEFKTLAEICDGWSVTLSRVGGSVRMLIY